jgi:pSer/pThr/pTyr-binding forkhead associated (FHA) protein
MPDEGISPTHTHVNVEANGVWIADMGSASGTFVNGQRITQSVWLNPNDLIQLGSVVRILFQSSPAVPPSPVIPAQPPPQKKKRSRGCSCVVTCGVALLVFICALIAVGAGGYYFYTTGQLSPRVILNTVGMGTGEINFVNIADSRLDSELYQLTTESGEPELFLDLSLNPFEVGGIGSIPPGSYELKIRFSEGVPTGGSCWLRIESGNMFQVVAVPEGIAISKEGENPTNPDEIDYTTSSLCYP